MTEFEKVMRGLYAHILQDSCRSVDGKWCPYRDVCEYPGCDVILAEDVLALLRAAMPRVMTKSEAEQYIARGKHPTEYSKEPPLYVEYKDDQSYYVRWVTVDMAFAWGVDFDRWQKYGTEFRFWTSRPTPEQMASAPWKGDAE